eukprot:gb/GEZN01015637.1/.p1 GENE.gb/GEZN01015637.1/~~gb/GEZN01015637.1/.p1  ORF type:complete len:261 (-),score=17.27 gb/GEZN01015637.1/:74-856(-)
MHTLARAVWRIGPAEPWFIKSTVVFHRTSSTGHTKLKQCLSVKRRTQDSNDCAAFVAEDAVVIGEVSLGRESSVFYKCVLRGDINCIKIGARTNVQDGCVIHVSDSHGVEVGEGVSIGHNAVLHACTVGDHCIIGMGAIVMDRAEIGRESVLGAGAIVPPGKIFPERSVIIGSPAQRIRTLTDEEFKWNLESANKYIRVALDHHDGQKAAEEVKRGFDRTSRVQSAKMTLAGDWNCTNCAAQNFRQNQYCFSCGLRKPDK